MKRTTYNKKVNVMKWMKVIVILITYHLSLVTCLAQKLVA